MADETLLDGTELRSPIFVSFPDSPWRSRLLRTWDYLTNQFYITADGRCGTHIHVSIQQGYDLDDLKRIAKAAFYFEPAFDALVPPHRRGDVNRYAQNLWFGPLHSDIRSINRLELLKSIDDITDFDTFRRTINPVGRYHSWNFCSIAKYYTVELRKPPACTTAEKALGWAEVAMAFVQSSIKCGTEDVLRSIPSTVGGLRSFLERGHVSGINELERLDTIFEGVNPGLAISVKPNFCRLPRFAHTDALPGDANISVRFAKQIRQIKRELLDLAPCGGTSSAAHKARKALLHGLDLDELDLDELDLDNISLSNQNTSSLRILGVAEYTKNNPSEQI
jgi:Putative amidoligase enzyme